MGRHFKVMGFWTDWKSQGISDRCYLLFLVIFGWIMYCLLKWIKFSVKKKQNIKKNSVKMGGGGTGKVGEFCQSGKVRTMFLSCGWNKAEPSKGGFLCWSTFEKVNILFKWNSKSLHISLQITWDHFKNNEKIPGNLLKMLETSCNFVTLEKWESFTKSKRDNW